MKRFVLITLLLVSAFAVSKLKAEDSDMIAYYAYECTLNVKENGQWSGWKPTVSCRQLVAIDVDNNFVCFFEDGSKADFYTIVSEGNGYRSRDGANVLAWRCKDEMDDPCTVSLVLKNGDIQLFVEYDSIHIWYHLRGR